MLIHRQTLNAVLPATTDDNSRYFLHAVECSPDGRVSATNGHVGFVAKNRTKGDDRAIITAVRITMTGTETELYGAIMPCRI